MKYRTRGSSSPQGKPRVYFTGHPADVKEHFDSVTDAILKLHNCAIFYDEDPEHPEDAENFISDLERMQLIVVVVTGRYVYGDTFAHNTVFRHAMERHIPVLPILEESGIEQDFNKKCGDLQCLDPNAKDDTALSFGSKLKTFLDSILVGDELAAKVREAFDAYVFLSYRKKDRRYAQQLMRLIHQNPFCRDIAIWYDEFLVPGENFNDAIQKALEKSELFALVVTPNLLEASNYIMSTEYPAARAAGKPILPAMLVPTDGEELAARYEAIPTPIDPMREGALPAALRDALAGVVAPKNDDDPQHIFFIGLAYLGGIDVEVNYEFAVRLITRAAEAGLPEAVEKLVAMYRTGEGVGRDYHTAIQWQEWLVELYRRRVETDTDVQSAANLVFASRTLGDYCMELPDYSRARSAYLVSLQFCQAIIKVGQDSEKTLSGPPQGKPSVHEFMQSVLWASSAKHMEQFLPVCYDNLGDACRQLGMLEEAKNCYENSLRIDREAYREDPNEKSLHDLFLSLQRLGDICLRMGDDAGAARYYQELESLTETQISRRDKMLAYNKRGDECLHQNDLAQAEVYFRKQYALAQELYAEDQNDETMEDLSACCGRLAQVCWSDGRLEEAEAYARQELALAQEWLKNSDSWPACYQVSIGYEHLGHIFSLKGKTGEAEEQLLECLTLRRELLARSSNQQILTALASVCGLLSTLCLDQQRFQEARSYGLEMFQAAGKAGAEAETEGAVNRLFLTAQAWCAAAAELIEKGRYEEARNALTQARELGQFLSNEAGRPIRDIQGKEVSLRPLAAMIQWHLRVVHLNLGDFPRAEQAGLRCGDLFTKLWRETGDPAFGEIAADSWRIMASLYKDPVNIAYYARQSAAVYEDLYRKTGSIQYLPFLAEDHFQLGTCCYDQGKWQEAINLYQKALDIQNKYGEESGDWGREKLALICKCAYYMGRTSWELKNHADAKVYLGYALHYAHNVDWGPDGCCLPPRLLAIACYFLSLLAEEDKDWEKAAQYSWLSYEQWKQAAEDSQEAFDWNYLAIVCFRIAQGQRDPNKAREACSIWDRLARRFPDEPLYAEQRDRAGNILELLITDGPGG